MPVVIGPNPPPIPQIGSGLSTVTVENLLEDVSLALVEPIVNAVLGTNISSGVQTVQPNFMVGIYPGALLVVGSGSSLEVVLVTDTTATSFTANFVFPHVAYDPVFGATFPSGFPDNPLFTQVEVLGYLTDVENDFLLRTRCVFEVTGQSGTPANIPFSVGNRFYLQPAQAIRVERVARIVSGQPTTDLYDTTQTDLDLENFAWSAQSDVPQRWFRDQIDTSKLGLEPMPSTNGTLECWYSKRGPIGILTLTSTLLIPDVMSHYIKYGILAKCWSKDGETRDLMRSDYCKKRYDFGIMLVQRFMEGVGIDTGAKVQSFSPMAVPAG
jgi:hypothetical protein